MITKLIIEYFQSHKKTEIDFSSGMNIITGASDQGKSAIIKALVWVFTNKPLSDPFVSSFAKHGEVCSVTVHFDDGRWVQRRRKNNNPNEYISSETTEPLTSFGNDVPQEIKDILNIEDHNIQSQHDQYFLIQSPPPEVAKKFNEKAGLGIINEVSSLTKKQKNQTKARIEISDKNIRQLRKEIKDLDYIDKFGKKIAIVEESIIKREEQRTERRQVFTLSKELKSIQKELKVVNIWLEVKDDIIALAKDANIMDKEIFEKESLEKHTFVIQDLNKKIVRLNQQILAKEEIISLIESTRINKKEETERNTLLLIVDEAKGINSDIDEIEEELKGMNEKLKDLYTKIKNCPICEQEINDEETINLMAENMMRL